LVTRAGPASFTDAAGQRWIDAASGGFGAGFPEVTTAIDEQARRIALSSRVLLSRPLAVAVSTLAEFCPGPLSLSYLCSSGGEALDSALKLARGVHPDRRVLLGVQGEDHGSFSHGRSLTLGRETAWQQAFRPRSVPGDLSGTLPEQVGDDVAAVVVAPAAPGRSLAKLDEAWWVALRERCHRHGTLLILDERGTGPARLGLPLGMSALGILPDVLVLGDTLGGDAVPVGAFVTSRALYDSVYGGRNPSVHGSTFGANPLSAAAVTATLTAVTRHGLAAKAQAGGERLFQAIEHVVGGPVVDDAAADGMLLWLRTRTPALAASLAGFLAEQQILVRPPRGSVVAVLPPLTAAPVELDVLEKGLAAALAELAGLKEDQQ
jgi:acetylornithine/succinyldiaminopimelate/putrescine aminotransferase